MPHLSWRDLPRDHAIIAGLMAVLVPCVWFAVSSTPTLRAAAVQTVTPIASPAASQTAGPIVARLGVVGLGDSVTQGDSTGPTPGQSWFGQLTTLDQRLSFVWNAGIHGETTAEIRARVSTDVIDRHPQVCLVMGGTNDIGQDVPQATTIGNLTGIVDSLKAAKIEVALVSIPPRSDLHFATRIAGLNAAIKQLAGHEQVPYLDVHDVVSTPAGGYAAGDTSDGVHPTEAGGHAMAVAAADQLAKAGL